MTLYKSILSSLFVGLVLLEMTGCTGSVHHDPQDEIQQRIEADLKRPAQFDDWEIDTQGLPKKRFIADTAHSSIAFRTEHWEIVDLIGWFNFYEVIMFSDSLDFVDAVIYARVDASSVEMPNHRMMGSVVKTPYLNSDLYPFMFFNSDSLVNIASNNYRLHGTLSINGISKKIIFKTLFNGYAYPGEQNICGFDVRGVFDRHDFDVGSEEILRSSKKIHGDSIHLHFSLRME